MLVSMSDLACCDLGEVIVTKPTIDARTDPTRPPTAVIDTATGLVTPILPTARVTVIEPEPWWKTAAVIGGAILAFGAALWILRRLAPADDDLGDTVIVRRRRPTVIYEDTPAPIFLPSRSEPTVLIEEPPNVLVNPPKGKKAKRRKKGHHAPPGWVWTKGRRGLKHPRSGFELKFDKKQKWWVVLLNGKKYMEGGFKAPASAIDKLAAFMSHQEWVNSPETAAPLLRLAYGG